MNRELKDPCRLSWFSFKVYTQYNVWTYFTIRKNKIIFTATRYRISASNEYLSFLKGLHRLKENSQIKIVES